MKKKSWGAGQQREAQHTTHLELNTRPEWPAAPGEHSAQDQSTTAALTVPALPLLL